MSRVLLVGNATFDIICSVSQYPAEDEEVRATAQRRQRGGNAANTAVVLAQYGHRVSFAGSLAEDVAAQAIRADLMAYGVELDSCVTMTSGQSPLSCITHSQQTGSRTIIHYRDLPEYPLEAFSGIPLNEFDWFHFEGRNLPGLIGMLDRLDGLRIDQPVSIEIEKDRAGIEHVFSRADVLLFSRAFARARGYRSAEQLFESVTGLAPQTILVCAWAEQGAYAQLPDGQRLHQPAQSMAAICDSVGAGDTFNAGLINSLVSGGSLAQALREANALAAKKLAQTGFALLVN